MGVQRFCSEVIIWNSLTHKNILTLLGVLGGISSPKFSTMTDFMSRGNIMRYIGNNHSNRLQLVTSVLLTLTLLDFRAGSFTEWLRA